MSEGEVLGVDCFELYKTGTVLYPDIAGLFDTSAAEISSVGVEGAFIRTGGLGLGSTGPYAAWAGCVNTVDGWLARTGTNLRDTGAALVLAAETYAVTDTEAQAEFDRRRAELDQ